VNRKEIISGIGWGLVYLIPISILVYTLVHLSSMTAKEIGIMIIYTLAMLGLIIWARVINC
jgi:hypothetical protein